ncbi:MAG: spermidine/putrescine ABC transporter ATP-binding protein [Proteocatella sp.]
MEKNLIELVNINKIFEDDGKQVLTNINLAIKEKEFVTFLGPSGCGKTTTLRIIGGFTTHSSGEVLFDGSDITKIPPYKRQINTVFQKYALFPHLNIYENIAFGLRIKKIDNKTIDKKVKKMLKLVNLEGFENREIQSLSGGQQQRIAIARALVNEPKVLLLDEPLGALDLKLRKDMQYELKTMQQELGITFIYVTHDQEEALTMSDRIVIMKDGIIQQIGTPEDIYNEPMNRFVADFIGESNIMNGMMIADYKCVINNVEFECVDKGFDKNEFVDIVIRPEDLVLVNEDESDIKGIVTDVVFKGVHYEIIVVDDFDKKEWMVHSIHNAKVDSKVGLKFEPEAIHIMRKEVG